MDKIENRKKRRKKYSMVFSKGDDNNNNGKGQINYGWHVHHIPKEYESSVRWQITEFSIPVTWKLAIWWPCVCAQWLRWKIKVVHKQNIEQIVCIISFIRSVKLLLLLLRRRHHHYHYRHYHVAFITLNVYLEKMPWHPYPLEIQLIGWEVEWAKNRKTKIIGKIHTNGLPAQ